MLRAPAPHQMAAAHREGVSGRSAPVSGVRTRDADPQFHHRSAGGGPDPAASEVAARRSTAAQWPVATGCTQGGRVPSLRSIPPQHLNHKRREHTRRSPRGGRMLGLLIAGPRQALLVPLNPG